jgi:hypothetical protein
VLFRQFFHDVVGVHRENSLIAFEGLAPADIMRRDGANSVRRRRIRDGNFSAANAFRRF